MTETLKLVPMKRDEAQAFINAHHRHHVAPVGDVFRIGLEIDGKLSGCVMVGRPVARHLDDGETLEINRCCVLPRQRNACTRLYGAAARAAKALGYTKLVTYTLKFESGSSLRGAGWLPESCVRGRLWTTPTRLREQVSLFQEYEKIRWVKVL